MSNIEQAKESIKAEIAYAMQGLSFYQNRIAALEKALENLNVVPDADVDQQVPRGRGRKAKSDAAKPAAGGKRGRRAAGAEAEGGALPSTGGTFWIDLIGSEPKTAPEILDAAVAKMGASLSKELRKKLAQRMVTAIHGMVKSGQVSDSGKGRERRFYKA
ncbi:hypothetical protein SAMN06265795_103213 [Noviherbaspirillum humi]|uniref:Uncharacterized protein n=1 Tax=Noviherbaspirillum humi TaxID=1688639 RepID=A0A239F778_9BURK|nr:hypothetical protein [Noviherbaspirillum humi]SNS52611.1 hypothetical protein SAMN06265795_103213 [Noviherbaspirillum humi]